MFRFFDKFEDKVRNRLSRYPIVYAIIGAVGIVLFWRGVWLVADDISWMTGEVSLVVSILILLSTGLFVSFFIGDNIILTGLKKEKKLAEKTESEIRTEGDDIADIKKELRVIKETLEEVKKKISI